MSLLHFEPGPGCPCSPSGVAHRRSANIEQRMTRDPERLVGELGLAILAIVHLWRVFVRATQVPTSPDPWDKEIEKAMHEPECLFHCICISFSRQFIGFSFLDI